jgi:cellulose synthase/poly-beta-1,6-N-acetylglucosamine synthase-like glycosyltransferase
MSLIELIPLVLSLVILGFTLLNSLTLWSTEITKDSAETKTAHNSISLLIPMRNEAANVEELLHALDSVEGIESI